MKKDIAAICNMLGWFKDNLTFDVVQKDMLVSFSSGHVSKSHADANPDIYQNVAVILQNL